MKRKRNLRALGLFALFIMAVGLWLQIQDPADIYRVYVAPRAEAQTITDLSGTTGNTGQEDISWGNGEDSDTFTIVGWDESTVTLTKVPSLFANAYSIIKGKWYVTQSTGDQGNVSLEGSLAYIIDAVGTDEISIELPGNQEYTVTTNLTIPATVTIHHQRGAILGGTGNLIYSGRGSVIAGRYQIWSTTGTITLPTGQVTRLTWFEDFAYAVTKIASIDCTMEMDEPVTMDENVTSIPASLKFDFKAGNTITTTGYTLGFSGRPEDHIIAPYGQECFTGTGTVSFGKGGTVSPHWWDDDCGDGATDVNAAIQAANDSLPAGGGRVLFQEGDYRSSVAITQGSKIVFEGVTSYSTILTFTGAASNGIVFDDSANCLYPMIKNMAIYNNNSSTGTGIIFAGTNTLSDPLIENVYVDGFANGITLAHGINGKISKVRVTGLGKATASSTGIKFHDAGSGGTTTMLVENPYVSGFETNYDFDGYGHTVLNPKSETSDIHYHANTGHWTIINPGAEDVDTAADKIFKTTSGYFMLSGDLSATSTVPASITINGNPTVVFDFDETGKEASRILLQEVTHIRAHVHNALANQTISTATNTKIQYDNESTPSYDRQAEYDAVTNYRFTANKPRAYYAIYAQIQWASTQDDSWIAIYKDGALITRGDLVTDTRGNQVNRVSDTLKLDVGEYIEFYCRQNSGGDIDINYGDSKSFMTIHEIP